MNYDKKWPQLALLHFLQICLLVLQPGTVKVLWNDLKISLRGVWWHTLVSVYGRLRQEDCCEFEAGLSFIMTVKTARATRQDSDLSKKKASQNT